MARRAALRGRPAPSARCLSGPARPAAAERRGRARPEAYRGRQRLAGEGAGGERRRGRAAVPPPRRGKARSGLRAGRLAFEAGGESWVRVRRVVRRAPAPRRGREAGAGLTGRARPVPSRAEPALGLAARTGKP